MDRILGLNNYRSRFGEVGLPVDRVMVSHLLGRSCLTSSMLALCFLNNIHVPLTTVWSQWALIVRSQYRYLFSE